MNRFLLVFVAIVVGVGLFAGGFLFNRVSAQTNQPGWMTGNWNGQANHNMMGGWNDQAAPGMMGIGQFGPCMMGDDQNSGMMNGGMMGAGMMGSYGDLTEVDPLSIEAAETAVTNYLATLNNDNLSLGEIMIFDNHAYVQIMDETSGTGAFEVLVDPVTLNVFPEPGPNMMWNTEYGMMSATGNFGMMGMLGGMMNGQFGSGMMGNNRYGSGMMHDGQYGSMMGGFGYPADTEIDITADEAVSIAQEYLDSYLPGKTVYETADAFPGYYTLHVLEDGEIIGMLSVNAYTGQVFLHHWHGDFIEMAGEEHG